MIYITQLIYLNEGQEATFNEFEKIAIPAIARYNGRLLLRIRTPENHVIESGMEIPYEIHLVEFDSDKDLENFSMDRERKAFLHLKEKSVRSSLLIKGNKI